MNIKSYVPELTLLKNKSEQESYLFREDCAMVDPTNALEVVACRGKGIGLGGSLTDLYAIPPSEVAFMQRALTTHKRILLQGQRRPILIFGDLLDASGLLLAVSPSISAASAARLLRHLARTDFAITPTLDHATEALQAEDRSAYDNLSELLYYTDRILSTDPTAGVWTRTLLIAHFAGCILEHTALPVDPLPLSRTEQNRLTAFLLCAFLTLRMHDAKISAGIPRKAESASTVHYRMEILPLAAKPTKSPLQLPFSHLPAFCDLAICSAPDSATVLEMLLHPETEPHIRAINTDFVGIRLILTKILKNL